MALELKFHKTDDTPWGFRLTGGAECEVPLTVIKVAEGSIAEDVGLQVDDVIVEINNKPVSKLTHAEVHDVLLASGNEFSFGVYRGEMILDSQDERQSNDEVCNIMESSLQNSSVSTESKQEQVSTLEVSEESHTRVSSNLSVTDEKIAEVISGETVVLPKQNILGVNFDNVDLSESTVLQALKEESSEVTTNLQNKRWSTFLQKPSRPKMVPKKNEPEGPQYPPYRVIIKKQKKKSEQVAEEIQENFSASISETTEDFAENPTNKNIDEQSEVQEEPPEHISDNERNEDEDHADENPNDEEPNDEENSKKQSDDEENASEDEQIKEAETIKNPPNLEDQLAQVQQQLEALSQLPSTIQVTLDAVTKQLAKIVRATHSNKDEASTVDPSVTSEEENEYIAEGETLESTMATLEEAPENSDAEDNIKFDTEFSDVDSREDKQPEDNLEMIEDEPEAEPTEPEPTEEELEAKRMEAEKVVQQEREEEFHQRRLEQRPTHPLTPLQRPIILPGGRRWSQPDDAVPLPKMKAKMTDEKISETLDTYSEIVVGHTKGINFMKYQPPPKNLDYLQHSEVFKLIHDNEPPKKGIAARPGRVVSEQDYYAEKTFHGEEKEQLQI